MPAIASQTKFDPLRSFVEGAFSSESKRLIPLVATDFDVSIDAGLATVTTKRIFRNAEPNSIEATITFPLPVHATLFRLDVRINGRTLNAHAKSRNSARETYEDGLDRGKMAVLHEEVLRGVHMLSVGHLAAGAEIEVETTWAMLLTVVGDRRFLRIPLTVGQIYGRSPLPDSDDLICEHSVASAALSVRCSSGTATLQNGNLRDGQAQVGLDMPIDILVMGSTPRDLHGRAADGREIVLRIDPLEVDDTALSIAMLIDHSGSMDEACSGEPRSLSKHEEVRRGLKTVAPSLQATDFIDVWEFDSTSRHVGATSELVSNKWLPFAGRNTPSARLEKIADKLSAPAGGTEIGLAIDGVLQHSTAHDVVLVTDGKSYALDVHALVQSGRRYSVVLIGEDSLEAKVGHLAALTGGHIFVVCGHEVGESLEACFKALRRTHEIPKRAQTRPESIVIARNGARISVEWRGSGEPVERCLFSHAVAAVAANLALPALGEEEAIHVCEAEGLVTHLTSLVLVDEASEVQEGLPATRKVALSITRDSFSTDVGFMERYCSVQPMPRRMSFKSAPTMYDCLPSFRRSSVRTAMKKFSPFAQRQAPENGLDLSAVGPRIPWDEMPNQLVSGDLSRLDPPIADLIKRAAALPEALALAARLNVSPEATVIGLLAHYFGPRSRTAARIAKSILGEHPPQEIDSLASAIGFSAFP